MGRHFASTCHGSKSTTAFAHSRISSRVFAMGPLTLITASWPARPDAHRCVVNLPKDGRRVNMPVHAAGIRRLPPISVPTPSGLPPKAIRADSPPDDPPEVNFRLRGLSVLPNTLLTDSAIIIAVGTLVLQYLTAPAPSKSSTNVALYVAGLLTNEAKPTVLSLPMTLKLSLREMGRPCKAPLTFPVVCRCSSRDFAHSIASSKKTSERQLVYFTMSAGLSPHLTKAPTN
jgi:hypothetical protein